MSGRHQPTNGADSIEAWDPRPFVVTVCDRFDEDYRFTVMVAAAIGPHDAMSQVRMTNPHVAVLKAVPA